MEKIEGAVKIGFLFLGIVVLLVFLLFLLTVILGFFLFSISDPVVDNSAIDDSSSTLIPIVSNEPVVQDYSDLWNKITKEIVEVNCFNEAKKSAGDLSWVISSCTCIASETSSLKSYSCEVSALDGLHDLSVECYKINGSCTIVSEQGTISMTFEELAELIV